MNLLQQNVQKGLLFLTRSGYKCCVKNCSTLFKCPHDKTLNKQIMFELLIWIRETQTKTFKVQKSQQEERICKKPTLIRLIENEVFYSKHKMWFQALQRSKSSTVVWGFTQSLCCEMFFLKSNPVKRSFDLWVLLLLSGLTVRKVSSISLLIYSSRIKVKSAARLVAMKHSCSIWNCPDCGEGGRNSMTCLRSKWIMFQYQSGRGGRERGG